MIARLLTSTQHSTLAIIGLVRFRFVLLSIHHRYGGCGYDEGRGDGCGFDDEGRVGW